MLIHVLPKLYVPGELDAAVRLVDLTIEEAGLVLKGDQELTVRRPYPDKCYWVGCRQAGQKEKAVAGIFIETEKFLEVYTVVTRWAINADTVLTHRVEHIVLDGHFDSVSDDMTLWYATSESLGNWHSRWPMCYNGMPPLKVQPCMDVLTPDLGGSKRDVELRDVLSEDGLVIRREERFMVHTIERSRFQSKWAEIGRLPELKDAFTVAL